MRGIEHLHPEMKAKAEQLQALCKAQNLPLLITETLRTTAEQDALYVQGRTKPGSIVTNAKGSTYSSAHQWGVAFDFCKNIKGQEYSDTAFFNKVGALGKSIGLFWGGDFKSFTDRPHFELPKYLPNNSTATLKSKYGTPEKFKLTWEDDEMTQEQFEAMYKTMMDKQSKLGVNPNTAPAEFDAAIKSGITDGTRPQAPVTRQEAAVMAYRGSLK